MKPLYFTEAEKVSLFTFHEDESLQYASNVENYFSALGSVEKYEGTLYKVLLRLSSTPNSGVEKVEEGKFAIDNLVFKVSKIIDQTLRAALILNYNGNLTQIKEGLGEGRLDQEKELQAMGERIKAKLLPFLIEDMETNQESFNLICSKIAKEVIMDVRDATPFNFSRYQPLLTEAPQWQKDLSAEVTRLAQTYHRGVNTFYVSWRPADILMMSKHIGGSCYNAGGLYQFAPGILASGRHTFVCYSESNNKNDGARFFGMDFENFFYTGRQYGSGQINFGFARLTEGYVALTQRDIRTSVSVFGKDLNFKFEKLYPEQIYTGDASNHASRMYIPEKLNGVTESFFSAMAEAYAYNPKGDYQTLCPECGDTNVHFEEYALYCCVDSREICSCCEESYSRDNGYDTVDGTVCEYCYGEHYYECDHCGEVHYREYVHHVNDAVYCESCFENNFSYCEKCDEPTQNENMITNEDGNFCSTCHREWVVECEECGENVNLTGEDEAVVRRCQENSICLECEKKLQEKE